jgi:hypothetical protein
MGWKSKKCKLRIKRKKYNLDKAIEKNYLENINKLPNDLIRNIIPYLDINVLNIIKPIKNIPSIRCYTSKFYWLNYHIYFWMEFNKNKNTKNKIKEFFNQVKLYKYFRYNKKIYHSNNKKSKKLLKKYVIKDVKKFEYDSDQEERNINDRLIIKYTENIILEIINSKY